ncbi:MAG: hypothetical protein WD607_08060 [Candidatus Paceibacterota bacterium]
MSKSAIHSMEEFLEEFLVGDVFYTISSLLGKPRGVEGPIRILSFYRTAIEPGSSYLVMNTRKKSMDSFSLFEEEKFVSDMLNEFHGVFCNRKDAERELKRRKAIFNSSPILQDEFRKNREESSQFIHEIFWLS